MALEFVPYDFVRNGINYYAPRIEGCDKVICPHCSTGITNRPPGDKEALHVVSNTQGHFTNKHGCDYTSKGKVYPKKVFDQSAMLVLGDAPPIRIRDVRHLLPYRSRTDTVAGGVAHLLHLENSANVKALADTRSELLASKATTAKWMKRARDVVRIGAEQVEKRVKSVTEDGERLKIISAVILSDNL